MKNSWESVSILSCLDLEKLTEKVRPAPPMELIGHIQGGTTLQPGASSHLNDSVASQHYAEMPNTLKVTLDGGASTERGFQRVSTLC